MTVHIPTLKSYLKQQIDFQASSRLVNPLATIQQAKLEEARDIVDQLDDPKEEEALRAIAPEGLRQTYPLLSAGIGIDGKDITEVAIKVQSLALKFRAYTSEVERVRRLSKLAIDQSTTKEQCEAAFLATKWPDGNNA